MASIYPSVPVSVVISYGLLGHLHIESGSSIILGGAKNRSRQVLQLIADNPNVTGIILKPTLDNAYFRARTFTNREKFRRELSLLKSQGFQIPQDYEFTGSGSLANDAAMRLAELGFAIEHGYRLIVHDPPEYKRLARLHYGHEDYPYLWLEKNLREFCLEQNLQQVEPSEDPLDRLPAKTGHLPTLGDILSDRYSQEELHIRMAQIALLLTVLMSPLLRSIDELSKSSNQLSFAPDLNLFEFLENFIQTHLGDIMSGDPRVLQSLKDDLDAAQAVASVNLTPQFLYPLVNQLTVIQNILAQVSFETYEDPVAEAELAKGDRSVPNRIILSIISDLPIISDLQNSQLDVADTEVQLSSGINPELNEPNIFSLPFDNLDNSNYTVFESPDSDSPIDSSDDDQVVPLSTHLPKPLPPKAPVLIVPPPSQIPSLDPPQGSTGNIIPVGGNDDAGNSNGNGNGNGGNNGDTKPNQSQNSYEGKQIIIVQADADQQAIRNFGGVGRGVSPSEDVIREVDTLKFTGAGLTAQNLLLTQSGSDLQITFEGILLLQVVLKNLVLDNLDNLTTETQASITIGNILFDGQTTISDSFDIFDADDHPTVVYRSNTVTFLNDLDNTTEGFDNSDDVINGQGGNDILVGLSGNDTLRGGDGNDFLLGSEGEDFLVGNMGADTLNGGAGSDRFFLSPNSGTDIISDFQLGIDRIQLSEGLLPAQLSIVQDGNNTHINFQQQTLAVLLGIQAIDLKSSVNLFTL